MVGQYLMGYHEYNDNQKTHGEPEVGYIEYLGEGSFYRSDV
jgi:hypothetical protein